MEKIRVTYNLPAELVRELRTLKRGDQTRLVTTMLQWYFGEGGEGEIKTFSEATQGFDSWDTRALEAVDTLEFFLDQVGGLRPDVSFSLAHSLDAFRKIAKGARK